MTRVADQSSGTEHGFPRFYGYGLVILIILVALIVLSHVLLQGRLPAYARAASIEASYARELEQLRAHALLFSGYRWNDNQQRRMREECKLLLSLPEIVEVNISESESAGGRTGVQLVDKGWNVPGEWSWGYSGWPYEPGDSVSLLRRTAGRDYVDYMVCLLDETGQAVVLSVVLDVERMRRN